MKEKRHINAPEILHEDYWKLPIQIPYVITFQRLLRGQDEHLDSETEETVTNEPNDDRPKFQVDALRENEEAWEEILVRICEDMICLDYQKNWVVVFVDCYYIYT